MTRPLSRRAVLAIHAMPERNGQPVRLVLLPWYPVMDKTEARCAKIARRRLAKGDWVTP